MALWFIALAVVILAVAVVENAAVMSMVSLSEAYMKASAVEREQLQVVMAVAMPLFGHGVVFPMLAPLGLGQLILAIWLIAKGFRDQPSPEVHPSDF